MPAGPQISNVLTPGGYDLQVVFSEEMDGLQAGLLDPNSYAVVPQFGVPVTIDLVTVAATGNTGSPQTINLHHSGTTLGGVYEVSALGLVSLLGNPVDPTAFVVITRGDSPGFSVTVTDGDKIGLQFTQPLLESNDVVSTSSYEFTSNPEYPVTLRPDLITLEPEDHSRVHMVVRGMTGLNYTCRVGPSLAFNYEGAIKPDASTEFTGQEVDPQGGSSQIQGGILQLAKANGLAYGWRFLDTSGRVIPSVTSFRADVGFDFTGATFTPALATLVNQEVVQIQVEDGALGTGVQILVTLMTDPNGADQVRLRSGNISVIFGLTWSSGPRQCTVIRNLQAGIYTFLWDGTPIFSAPLADLSQVAQGQGAGISFLLDSIDGTISGAKLSFVRFSASSTIYSHAWNLVQDATADFNGSVVLTRDSLMTQRGPLVKSWGDMTPATKADVTVLVNNQEVGVADVNPYTGEITLAVPIPLLPPDDPQVDVKVDYQWFATPIFEMSGLNTDGLVLNQWDRNGDAQESGVLSRDLPNILPGGPDDSRPRGAVGLSRFPMAVVLGPVERPQPLLIGHRYIGFERAYSALLNSPTTLLLNQSPFDTMVPAMTQASNGGVVAYDGEIAPQAAHDPWHLQGQDVGGVNAVPAGTYTVNDQVSGVGQATVYSRNLDLTFPASVFVVARFEVITTTPDGVFTGVGFGFHDDHHLYFVGALRVNGLEHVGMLIDPGRPHLQESWTLGPEILGDVLSSNTIRVTTADAPVDLAAGSRFQILGVQQHGVYTATQVIRHSTGWSEIQVNPSFPDDPKLYGSKFPVVLFETPWSGRPSTFRLTLDGAQKLATLDMSGLTTVRVLDLDGTVATMPRPADTPLILGTTETGQVFWGSLDGIAKSKSQWSFIRYGIIPDQTSLRSFSKAVDLEMDVLPDEDPGSEWFVTQPFGYGHVDAGVLFLKATSRSAAGTTTFGYRRIEPFFGPDVNMDARMTFRVDTGVLGAGDAEFIANDGQREVRFATILYADGLSGPYRQLVGLPSVSLAGLRDPTDQEWDKVSGSTGTGDVLGEDFVVTQSAGQRLRYVAYMNPATMNVADTGGRVVDARFAVQSSVVAGDGVTGIHFGMDVPGNWYIGVRLKKTPSPSIQLITEAGVVVHTYAFDWDDEALHSYRVVATGGVVTVFFDDVAAIPTLNLNQFPGAPTENFCVFGALDVVPSTASIVQWRSVSYSVLPPAGVKRTVGIWLGGPMDNLDSWRLPRTDSTGFENSEDGSVIVEMDWQSFMDVRLLRTPTWGVTMYRPDLALPGSYVPETPGDPGSGFATETQEPSAGWINVEYADLPRVPSKFGFIAFGALNEGAITQQRWDRLRFRVFQEVTADYQSPQHMVLNQAVVTASGEITADVTMERVAVETINRRMVSLKPANMYAHDIYKIVDGTRPPLTRESWDFDPQSQMVTLKDGVTFSGDHVAVTLVFIPGTPVTSTYLLSQPLLDSITLLNEGTPPIPKSQTADSSMVVLAGASAGDPGDDQYKVTVFEDDPASLYEDMQFMELDDGGSRDLISIAGEGMLPEGFSGFMPDAGGDPIYSPTGNGASLGGVGASLGLRQTGHTVGAPTGAHVLDFKGTRYWEKSTFPRPEAFDDHGGMPGHVLLASGGHFLGPVVDVDGNIIGSQPLGGRLGPGTAILHPSARNPGPGRIHRRTDWYFRITSVIAGVTNVHGQFVVQETPLSEVWDLSGLDLKAPTRPSTWGVNPPGGPVNFGAALALLSGPGDFSHVGPWGGMVALSASNDFGFLEFVSNVVPGDSVTLQEESQGALVTFVAANVPANNMQFATGPNDYVNLAHAINSHPVTSLYVKATAGVLWSGVSAVRIESIQPVSDTNLVAVKSLNVHVKVTGTIPSGSGAQLLDGGSKISQSSLLGGGSFTIVDGLHIPTRGMVCNGGAILPVGTSRQWMVTAT